MKAVNVHGGEAASTNISVRVGGRTVPLGETGNASLIGRDPWTDKFIMSVSSQSSNTDEGRGDISGLGVMEIDCGRRVLVTIIFDSPQDFDFFWGEFVAISNP